jgi:hypothetical protein
VEIAAELRSARVFYVFQEQYHRKRQKPLAKKRQVREKRISYILNIVLKLNTPIQFFGI